MLAWPRAIFFPASVAAAEPNKLKEIQLSIFSFTEYLIKPCQDTVICVLRARQILLRAYLYTYGHGRNPVTHSCSQTLIVLVWWANGGMDSFPSMAMRVWSVWKVALGWPCDGLCIVYVVLWKVHSSSQPLSRAFDMRHLIHLSHQMC